MFRIGEFSKLTQVSVRMLRYYDEMGLLKPAQIDQYTDYRLYSAAQIPTLNRILFLRDLGFQISEISEALKQWDDSLITKLLDQKRLETEADIKKAEDRLKKIELANRDIRQDRIVLNCNVAIKSIPGCHVFSLRKTVADYYCEGNMWSEMASYAREHRISLSANTFTIYHDMDYREKDVDIEICAPIAAAGKDADGFCYRRIEEVPFMACTLVYGPFENIAGAYLVFAEWIQEHNQYRMAGKNRQIVHRGPWNEKSADKYLTEIQIPLEKYENGAGCEDGDRTAAERNYVAIATRRRREPGSPDSLFGA